jgi:hypothetical protein
MEVVAGLRLSPGPLTFGYEPTREAAMSGVAQKLAERVRLGKSEPLGTSPAVFIRLSHRPVTLLSQPRGSPLAWISSLLSPAPLRGFFSRGCHSLGGSGNISRRTRHPSP